MTGNGIMIDLCKIDNGRFSDIVNAIGVKDICGQCGHFNPTIKDPRQKYRCYTTPHCIAATLNLHTQSYMWLMLGWIDEADHHMNIEL